MFLDTTAGIELTMEEIITGYFHYQYPDSFTVYFTDLFFYGLNQSAYYPFQFASCIKTSAQESWQKQVIESYFSKLLIEDRVSFKSLLTTILENDIV
jgi:hypothetical protein